MHQPEADASEVHHEFLQFSQEEEDDLALEEGNYSARMEKLLDEGEETPFGEEDSDDEGFLYNGVDSEGASSGYRDQLRDVLGHEHDEDEVDERETPNVSLTLDTDEPLVYSTSGSTVMPSEAISDHSPSTSSLGLSQPRTPSPMDSPRPNGTIYKASRPFLHPTVSRLRSYTPQASQMPSASSADTALLQTSDAVSPSASHFSAMSRRSSFSNPNTPRKSGEGHDDAAREVFKWTQLRTISGDMYLTTPTKATAVLGAPTLGKPTVLAANGLICVGTDIGKVAVYDFKQNLKCICGGDASADIVGPVSALALSHDHTFVASGHATGHIQLYDLKNPQLPARSVAPTALSAIKSGRKEGHLHGSRIVSIGFVAGRHTSIVSADDHGLAFSYRLGKVLFVEASDVLRILGKYPDAETADINPKILTPSSATRSLKNVLNPRLIPARPRKSRYTVLSMSPLPLGTSPHPTDAYNIIALLTPVKLVIVGLKPTPKTWFKRSRGSSEEAGSKTKSRFRGAVAWYPCVVTTGTENASTLEKVNGSEKEVTTTPILAYSWGTVVRFLRVSDSKVKQTLQSSRTGKSTDVEVGTVLFHDAGVWPADDDVLAIQWLNANQILLLTSTTLDVYDLLTSKVVERVPFKAHSLVSPLGHTMNGAMSHSGFVADVAHSVRVYKGKIFLLGRQEIQVGTLLTWADRILSFVQDGDFLSAIDLARSYYEGEAPGNQNGLPDDASLRKTLVGQKMHELMVASARYVFSEDRLTDGTHVTPDGRGVDRTSLFESLVSTCARACVALDEFEFLFEDLFQLFDDHGIARIFIVQMEAFILDNEIRHVPPRIAQRLVALHEEDNHSDLVERIIWHIDPMCLDINQAIRLCQRYQLYDALLYVYTRALKDYVSPIVELLGLIRKVQQFRNSRQESAGSLQREETTIEPIVLNAYKIYPYLANVLSGLTYPSEEPLLQVEAFQAKKEIYNFLFFGRSGMWPVGEGGKLVLTSDEEGGDEPTYPYARLLLRFDAEAFLHTLDIAFEDPYLNDESQGVTRLVIVKILLEILSSGNLASTDATFVNIFVARNLPKYPQFIQMAPSALHKLLICLASDEDQNTREDRQLAAEYLLSAYNPHDSGRILRLFEEAGFFRILRFWYRQERRWAPLLSTYLHDPTLHPPEVISNVDEVLDSCLRASKGTLPSELTNMISDSLPRLLQVSVTSTAWLIDKNTPNLHEKALEVLEDDVDGKEFSYLRYLLGPPKSDYDEYISFPRQNGPSIKVPRSLCQRFVNLQCQIQPNDLIDALKYLPPDLLDWSEVVHICEANKVYHAAVWALNWRGRPRDALSEAERFEKLATLDIIGRLTASTHISSPSASAIRRAVDSIERLGRVGIDICLEHSHAPSVIEVPLEDIWYQLLNGQIQCVQSISGCCSSEALSASNPGAFSNDQAKTEWQTLSTMRSIVHETFTSLVTISSTHAVSFPRLFKRLVDPTNRGHGTASTQYTEFRSILTGMLEAYRSDGEMLHITKHLVDRDLFDTVEALTVERGRGWRPSTGLCSFCKKALSATVSTGNNDKSLTNFSESIVVSRTGATYHKRCVPVDL